MIPKFLEGGAYGVLNDLLSILHADDGYAQPNRYEVIINPPSLPSSSSSQNKNWLSDMTNKSDLRRLSLRAASITLPGRNLSTSQESNIYGPDREIVEGVTYADDISINFQSSSGLEERVFFENWQRKAFNEETWNIGYYKDYIGSVDIYVLDKQDQRRYGIKLHEAFPKTIGANELSYGSENELMMLPISFTFRHWTSLDQNQNPPVNIFNKVFETVVNTAERNITRNIPKVLNKLF